jgi:PHD/YefM family antitoxin component YafN of YafNO toxin-antitoxin module
MTEAAVVIEQDGKPTHVVVPFAEWRRVQELLADLDDADEAVRSLGAWRAAGAPSLSLDEALERFGLTRDDLAR